MGRFGEEIKKNIDTQGLIPVFNYLCSNKS